MGQFKYSSSSPDISEAFVQVEIDTHRRLSIGYRAREVSEDPRGAVRKLNNSGDMVTDIALTAASSWEKSTTENSINTTMASNQR